MNLETKSIFDMTTMQLAVWLHNRYEDISEKVGWETQEVCKGRCFEELPIKNKKVMIQLAKNIQLRLVYDRKPFGEKLNNRIKQLEEKE